MNIPKVPLGACCEVVSGATPKTGQAQYWDGGIPWVTPKDLSALRGKYISSTHRTISETGLASCTARILPVGSVLFSSRAPIGHVAINAVPMATNQGFKSLVPNQDKIDASYLYHWLRMNRPALENLGNGATFKEVSKAIVERVEIPLPSLSEQRRISALLDQVELLRDRRRRTLALLDDLDQSTFLELFGESARSLHGWPMATVGDLIGSADYGSSEKADIHGEVPVLRMNNLTKSGRINLRDLKYLPAQNTGGRYLVRNGDILFNRTNSPDLVGKTAVYRGPEPMAYAGYLIRVRMNSENDPSYLSGFLNSKYGKLVLRNMCKSIVGMANINAKELRSIDIPQPPLKLQRQFAERVRQIARMREVHEAHMTELDALFASVRARAFAGELWETVSG